MPYALQVFDGQGQTVVDTGRRLGIILGVVDTGTADGSINVPGFGRGTPFFFMSPLAELANLDLVPGAGTSGQTLTWQFVGGTAKSRRVSVRIYYGIF